MVPLPSSVRPTLDGCGPSDSSHVATPTHALSNDGSGGRAPLLVRAHQPRGPTIVEVLDRLTHGDPRGAMRSRRDPPEDLVGPPLGGFPQHPPDGLPDEELLL